MRLTPSKLLISTLTLAAVAIWTNVWLESSQKEQVSDIAATLKEATWQFSETQIWRPGIETESNTLNFTAGQIRYQQNRELSHIDQLVLVDFRQNSLNLISSQVAVLDPQFNITLSQNVRFSHYAQQDETPAWQQQIQLTGEQFTYNNPQRRLTSSQPVTITQLYAVTEAGSLSADLTNGEWLFSDGVKGTIQPQTMAKDDK
ncbi:LPS export ABC transporter periplasmic protein LptC [Thiomicrorhabdus xiamenensis]|uniref:LPS export ABC transporter periplasmic protein LptC n=1 Tax=Thiomicrorhabdus xiamenensis TaxID=2739063 RepID=A0A7D4TGP0_9GAMM|nr:LPS export ABC transporter periplasmic protein LptC [Thiomicrorhabdus xiamenensis]QKI89748.1 LPS export ABC transporter periplasmic protein LptC [Thiomicrorhabdus xiamenensis]